MYICIRKREVKIADRYGNTLEAKEEVTVCMVSPDTQRELPPCTKVVRGYVTDKEETCSTFSTVM